MKVVERVGWVRLYVKGEGGRKGGLSEVID